MPKAPRTLEEVENIRRDIMRKALDLIVTEGYDGFTMRKLASRLSVSPKTIYNYFQNQDELYLRLLTKGFEQLHNCFDKATKPYINPMEKIDAFIAAYVKFGLENANIYNLMFTWHVPKYNDYINTHMEQVARHELETALKCVDFAVKLVREYLGESTDAGDDEIREEVFYLWAQTHGYIAGINNTLLNYWMEEPLSLKRKIIERAGQNIRIALSELSGGPQETP